MVIAKLFPEGQEKNPETMHRVTPHQIQRWCEGVAASPDEVLKRRPDQLRPQQWPRRPDRRDVQTDRETISVGVTQMPPEEITARLQVIDAALARRLVIVREILDPHGTVVATYRRTVVLNDLQGDRA
jgi:hypothetical protein